MTGSCTYDEAKVKCVEIFNDDIARHPILIPAETDAKPSVIAIWAADLIRPAGPLVVCPKLRLVKTQAW